MRSGIFGIIPDDVSKFILDHLGGAGNVINFTRTCKFSYSLFSKTDTAQLALQYFNHALDAASIGDWNKVYVLASICPDILLCTGTTSYCGRYKYESYIYQVGLKNYENGDKYHNKMLKLFEKLPNGKAEMVRQYLEVFPCGKMFCEKWDINTAKQLLDKLIEALRRDKTLDRNNLEKMTTEVRNAYKNFWDYINPTLGTSIEGLVCDPVFFDYIVEKYIEVFDPFTVANNIFYGKFDPVIVNQCIFYCVKLWDEHVKKLPTGILKALCQGLYYVVDLNEPLRDNGCVLRSGQRILPLGADSNFVFGRDTIEMYEGKVEAAGMRYDMSFFNLCLSGCVRNICQAKAEEHGNICAAIRASVQPAESCLPDLQL